MAIMMESLSPIRSSNASRYARETLRLLDTERKSAKRGAFVYSKDSKRRSHFEGEHGMSSVIEEIERTRAEPFSRLGGFGERKNL